MAKELIVIIDYGSGNLHSAAQACGHANVEAEIRISGDATDIAAADRLVLPGQGAFIDCMNGLHASGVIAALKDAVLVRRVPFLGICVGMQLLAQESHEHGITQGLGWIDGVVEPIAPCSADLKIPHMGWNDIEIMQDHPVMADIEHGEDFYFVHSYHFVTSNSANIIARCEYGGAVTAAVAKENIFGVQFHPEKSADAGLKLISNFLNWAV